MRADLAAIVAARRGHFLLESGHHGNLWLELDGMFSRPTLIRPLARELAARLPPSSVVCGPLTGGGFLAQMIAEELDARFVFAERMPDVTYRIPATLRAQVRGARVAVVDDVVNAASAARKTLTALRACGATPISLGALLVLGSPDGSSPAAALADEHGIPLAGLGHESTALWEPAECPLCDRGEPLEDLIGR